MRPVSARTVLLVPEIVVSHPASPVEFDRTTGFQHPLQLTTPPLHARFHPREREPKLCGGLLLSKPFKIDQYHRLPILS